MANDDTFGDLSGDMYQGFDLGDPGMDQSALRSRKPAGAAKKIITSSIKGAGKGVWAGISQEVERNFPSTAGVVREAISTVDDFKAMRDDIAREVGPAVNTLKQATLRAMPFAKKLVPAKMYNKIEQKLQDSIIPDEKSQSQIENEMRSANISQALNDVFQAQAEMEQQNRETDMAEKQVDRHIEKTRFNQTSAALASIDQRMLLTNNFLLKTTSGYMKKSLELKYQHLYVAKDTYNIMQGLAKVVEARLEEIKHNTALPEFSKVKMGERVFGSVKSQMGNDLASYVSGLRGAVMKNIRSAIMSPLQQFTQMAVPMIDSASQMAEMGIQSGMTGPLEKSDVAAGAGGLLGRGLGWLFGTAKTRELAKKAAPWINDAEGAAKNFKTRASLGLSDWADSRRGGGGLLGMLAQMVPQFRRNNFINNSMLSNAEQPVPFDNTTRQSIVEVMPRHLERIGMYMEGVAKVLAPNAKFEHKVFNVHKRQLTSLNENKEDIITHVLGSKEQRQQRLAQQTGTFDAAFASGSSNYGDQGDSTVASRKQDFSKNKKNIQKFIVNSGTYQLPLKPQYIRAFAKHGSHNDKLGNAATSYIKSVFTGIPEEEQQMTAVLLNIMMYRPDGTEEVIATDRLANTIMESISNNSSLIQSLSTYTETLGGGNVVLGDLYDIKTGLNAEAVNQLYTGERRTRNASKTEIYERNSAAAGIREAFERQQEIVSKFGDGDAYGQYGSVKNKLVTSNIPLISTLAKMMPESWNSKLSGWFKNKDTHDENGALITPEGIGGQPALDGIVGNPAQAGADESIIRETTADKKGILDQLVDMASDPEERYKVLIKAGIKDPSRLDGETDTQYVKRMTDILYNQYWNEGSKRLLQWRNEFRETKAGKITDIVVKRASNAAKETVSNLKEGLPSKEEVLESVAPEHRAAVEKAYDSAKSVEDFLSKCNTTVKDPETWKALRGKVKDGLKNIKDPAKRKAVTVKAIAYVDNAISTLQNKEWRDEVQDKAKQKGKGFLNRMIAFGDHLANTGNPEAQKLGDELSQLNRELEEARANGDTRSVRNIQARIRTRKRKLETMGGTGMSGMYSTGKDKAMSYWDKAKSETSGWWGSAKEKTKEIYAKMVEEQKRKDEERKEALSKLRKIKIGNLDFGGEGSAPAESVFHQDFRTFASAQIVANQALLQALQAGGGSGWGRHGFIGGIVDGTKGILKSGVQLGAAGLSGYGRAIGGVASGLGSLAGGALRGAGSAIGGVGRGLLGSGLLGGIASGGLRGLGSGIGGFYQGAGAALKGAGFLGGGIAQGLGLAINPFGGGGVGLTNMYRRLTRDKYFDVYLKDRIIPGKPLISAKQQEEGVYFADGKLLKNTMDITAPIFAKPYEGSGRRPKCLVTQDDIEQGLCDAQGKPLKEKPQGVGGLVGGLFKGVGNIFKGVTGLGAGVAGFWGNILKGGSGLAVDGAKGLSKMIGRMFGLDLGANKEYQDKMLVLMARVVKAVERGTIAGDADGDGIRDGSAEDQLKKIDAKNGDKSGMWFIDPKTGRKVSFKTALARGLCDSNGNPAPGVESGGGDGGSMTAGIVAGTAGAGVTGYAATKAKALFNKAFTPITNKVSKSTNKFISKHGLTEAQRLKAHNKVKQIRTTEKAAREQSKLAKRAKSIGKVNKATNGQQKMSAKLLKRFKRVKVKNKLLLGGVILVGAVAAWYGLSKTASARANSRRDSIKGEIQDYLDQYGDTLSNDKMSELKEILSACDTIDDPDDLDKVSTVAREAMDEEDTGERKTASTESGVDKLSDTVKTDANTGLTTTTKDADFEAAQKAKRAEADAAAEAAKDKQIRTEFTYSGDGPKYQGPIGEKFIVQLSDVGKNIVDLNTGETVKLTVDNIGEYVDEEVGTPTFLKTTSNILDTADSTAVGTWLTGAGIGKTLSGASKLSTKLGEKAATGGWLGKSAGLLNKGLSLAGVSGGTAGTIATTASKIGKIGGKLAAPLMLAQAGYGAIDGLRMGDEETEQFIKDRQQGAFGGGRFLDGNFSKNFGDLGKTFSEDGAWAGTKHMSKMLVNDAIGVFDFVDHGRTIGSTIKTAGKAGWDWAKLGWDRLTGKEAALDSQRQNVFLVADLRRLSSNRTIPSKLKDLIKKKLNIAFLEQGAPENEWGRACRNACSTINSEPTNRGASDAEKIEFYSARIMQCVEKMNSGDKAYLYVYENLDNLKEALEEITSKETKEESVNTEASISDITPETSKLTKELSSTKKEDSELVRMKARIDKLRANGVEPDALLLHRYESRKRHVAALNRQKSTGSLPSIDTTSPSEIASQRIPQPPMETEASKVTAGGVAKMAMTSEQTANTTIKQQQEMLNKLTLVTQAIQDGATAQKSVLGQLIDKVGEANKSNANALDQVGKLGVAALKNNTAPIPMSGSGSPAGAAIGVEKTV